MRFRSELGGYLNALSLTGIGVEVGVHLGHFSETILENWRGKQLWLVDPWRHLDDYLDSFNASDAVMKRRGVLTRKRLARFGNRTGWVRERSEQAVDRFDDESCDFVYIDANHGIDHVRNDLRQWYPKVKQGGLFAGHDYFDALADENLEPLFCGTAAKGDLTSYGVKSAVDEFVAANRIDLSLTQEKFPTWYFVKGM
jgi:hypothetical protein